MITNTGIRTILLSVSALGKLMLGKFIYSREKYHIFSVQDSY